MEDELWMRKIKERLEDYSEPLPVSGWERLEKDLSAPKPPVAGKRRIIPFRRWAVAAAASLLIAVSSVSVWLLQSPVGEEMRLCRHWQLLRTDCRSNRHLRYGQK